MISMRTLCHMGPGRDTAGVTHVGCRDIPTIRLGITVMMPVLTVHEISNPCAMNHSYRYAIAESMAQVLKEKEVHLVRQADFTRDHTLLLRSLQFRRSRTGATSL